MSNLELSESLRAAIEKLAASKTASRSFGEIYMRMIARKEAASIFCRRRLLIEPAYASAAQKWLPQKLLKQPLQPLATTGDVNPNVQYIYSN
jgi:hypothetical protein